MKNKTEQKKLKREYKETPRPLGIFQIRNLTNDKIFVASSINLDGIFNRHEFQLKTNVHANKDLQKDWNALGAENFAFEILEELVFRAELDNKKELEFLEDLWFEKLQPYGEKGYNEPKKSREERLRMIAAKRSI